MNFLKQVWAGYEPFLVKITIDFLIASTIWVALLLFKFLTGFLPIDGWAGDFISNLHSAGMVAAFGVLVVSFAIDVINIQKGRVLSLC